MSIDSSAWSLLLHSAVVLVIGNLCGFPFGRAIARRQPKELQRSVAAIIGHRGITMGRPIAARIVFAGNIIGPARSLLGSIALLWVVIVGRGGSPRVWRAT